MTEILCEQLWGVKPPTRMQDVLTRTRSASQSIRRGSWYDPSDPVARAASEGVFDMDTLKWTPDMAFYTWDRMLRTSRSCRVIGTSGLIERLACVHVCVLVQMCWAT